MDHDLARLLHSRVVMKASYRWAMFAMLVTTPTAVVAVGCSDVLGVGGATDAATLDGLPWPSGDGAAADRRSIRPPDEQWPGSCVLETDAGKKAYCDFGFACVYPREDGLPDAAPEPGCGSRDGAEACGGFWCGRGCHCKDPVAKVCACQ